MKPTWTLLPDLEDQPEKSCTVAEDIEENMQAALGLTLWAALEQREMEDENVRAQNG